MGRHKGTGHPASVRLKISLGGKGLKRSPETRRKISIAKTGIRVSEETKEKLRIFNTGKKMSIEFRRKQSERMKGSSNWAWKGGVTKEAEKIRKSFEYTLWRESVFERDAYTCIWCGAKSSKGKKVYLHADHIKPFAFFPELRFAIDNGRTLCIDCHHKTDTWGEGAKKYNPERINNV